MIRLASRPAREGLPAPLLLLSGTLALAGCGESARALSPEGAARLPVGAAGGGGEEAAPLRAARVLGIPDAVRYREVGEVRPWRRVTLAAEVAGRVTAVRFEAGERVEVPHGASATAEVEIAAIEEEGYRVALERASAAHRAALAAERIAERERERAEGLRAEGEGRALSLAEHDRLLHARELAAARTAEAAALLEEARLALSRCRVRGPEGYLVAERLVEPGDHVVPGRPIATLVDERAVRVALEVPGERLPSLPLGERVALEVKEWPGEAFSGTVVRAGPAADPRTRRFPVELRLENERGRLKAGMVAVVPHAVTRSARTLSVLPREAVGQRLEERFVLVLRAGAGGAPAPEDGVLSGAIELRPVLLLDHPDLPPSIVAADGVSPGEVVVLEALARYKGGERVRARLAHGPATDPVPGPAPDTAPR